MTSRDASDGSASDAVDLSTEAVAALVATHYGSAIGELTLLGAESSTVCRAQAIDGSVMAVKIFWDRADSAETIRWQHEVVSRLAESGLPVARPIRAVDGALTAVGEVDGRPVLLQASEWLVGTPLEDAPPTTPLLREVGRTAARLHGALLREKAPAGLPVHDWEITRSRSTIDAAVREIRYASEHRFPTAEGFPSVERLLAVADDVCRLLRDCVEPLLATLPRAVVHHDLHDSNLLVGSLQDPARVVGILDFGDMLESVRISEPIIAAAYAARNSREPLAAVREVLTGWSESVPVTAAESTVVLPLAAARLTANAAVWSSRLGSSRAAYAAARMRGSVRTAELLLHGLDERAPHPA
ncbi:phosphotransferase enzyme family protein [Subtercola boreus]|nr:phosphotransferase [Subtercola boreus]